MGRPKFLARGFDGIVGGVKRVEVAADQVLFAHIGGDAEVVNQSPGFRVKNSGIIAGVVERGGAVDGDELIDGKKLVVFQEAELTFVGDADAGVLVVNLVFPYILGQDRSSHRGRPRKL